MDAILVLILVKDKCDSLCSPSLLCWSIECWFGLATGTPDASHDQLACMQEERFDRPCMAVQELVDDQLECSIVHLTILIYTHLSSSSVGKLRPVDLCSCWFVRRGGIPRGIPSAQNGCPRWVGVISGWSGSGLDYWTAFSSIATKLSVVCHTGTIKLFC